MLEPDLQDWFRVRKPDTSVAWVSQEEYGGKQSHDENWFVLERRTAAQKPTD